MMLKLKQPPPDDEPPEQTLRLADLDRLQAQVDHYIDGLVAEQRKQLPNQPAEVLRMHLMRGHCLCRAAERLLAEQEPQ